MILSFIKNTEWAPNKMGDKSVPFVIGVYGKDPMEAPLTAALKKTLVKNREVILRTIETLKEVTQCHVLIARLGDDEAILAILKETRREGILTIGDSDKFLALGGIIQFVKNPDGHIGYRVNISNAARDGLRLNSSLVQNQANAPEPSK
jgi:hypothetical protein